MSRSGLMRRTGFTGSTGRMPDLNLNFLPLAVAILSIGTIVGCGKGTKAGPPLYPARINLTPNGNTSVNLGQTFAFTASAQTAGGTDLKTTFTYTSTDTAILNVAPNGVACAGHWDIAFTTCTPGGTGVVQVTASALGASSIPTYVFVHPVIDNIIVTGVLLDGVPVQEPCLSQGQSMAVEAHAFSQGSDVTSSVGPFTWSAQYASVVTLTPLVNIAYNFATNQATALAVTPGMSQIYASASGVSSSTFQQPQYTNSLGTTSPVLDFFETCPIQTIALEIGSGTQQTNQTTFVTSKGTTQQTATAILTDVLGFSSLPNTSNQIVLNKIPLTWTASRPGVVSTASACQQSCALSTPLPGAGSVTAACSPPACNIGFPYVPPSLSTPAGVAACNQFFQSQPGVPATFNCQQLIPYPVYAETAISGLVTGATAPAALLATSTGCSQQAPSTCTTSIYNPSTAKPSTGPETPLPSSPTSLLFDPAGDKAYMGSNFGALLINPGSFGTSNSPYTGLGTVSGNVLAVSNNGSTAVFSDTIHTPNQVYVVNTANSNSLSASAFNISQAVSAAFSPDGLKTFIFGNGGSSLYIYSPLQALQAPIALAGAAGANTVAFSNNGAFAYVAEAAATGGSANLIAFNTCNNQVAASPVVPGPVVPAAVTLPANPLFLKVLPGIHIEGTDSSGFSIPDGEHILVLDTTGFDVLTSVITPPNTGTLCPQTLTFVSGNPASLAQRVNLGQGTIQPLNFFASADGSLLYIPAVDHSSILVYNFGAGSVTSGIELAGNATPVSADMSVDAGTILVGGSDGMLHEVSTGLGGSDQIQVPFPNLPNYLNPFCAIISATNPCTLNLVAARP